MMQRSGTGQAKFVYVIPVETGFARSSNTKNQQDKRSAVDESFSSGECNTLSGLLEVWHFTTIFKDLCFTNGNSFFRKEIETWLCTFVYEN